ncbi:hypothetical protein, partial [Vibrio injensis]|uniref:hypothetical protein n=1 Tax=Vibrio injensis TaxID=1307414 RepID=UPI00278BF8A4
TSLLSAIIVVDKIPNKLKRISLRNQGANKLKRISLRNQGANNIKGKDLSATIEPFAYTIYQSRAGQKRTNIDKLAITKHCQQARCS